MTVYKTGKPLPSRAHRPVMLTHTHRLYIKHLVDVQIGLREIVTQVWWHMPIIPVLGRVRHEHQEFEAILGT
jgi:hypothetical protein